MEPASGVLYTCPPARPGRSSCRLQQPDPSSKMALMSFVLDSFPSQVLPWAHCTRPTCRPGIHQSLAFIRKRSRCPSKDTDVRSIIADRTARARRNDMSNFLWDIVFSDRIVQQPRPDIPVSPPLHCDLKLYCLICMIRRDQILTCPPYCWYSRRDAINTKTQRPTGVA